jgi:hypothetical protein
MDNFPITIPAPWISQIGSNDPDRWSKCFPDGRHIVYVCPLCGWYRFHPLSYCGHCPGKLERLALDMARYNEWKKGRMTDGT